MKNNEEQTKKEINSAFKNLTPIEILQFFKETKHVPDTSHTFALKYLVSKYNCVNIFNVLKNNGFDFNLGNGILLLDATCSLQSKNVNFLLQHITKDKLKAINLCLSTFIHYSEVEMNKHEDKIKDIFFTYGQNMNKQEMENYFEYVNPRINQIQKKACTDFLNGCHLILTNTYLNNNVNEKKVLNLKTSLKI